MQVRELMHTDPVTLSPGDSTALAARLLSRHNVGALPVCSSDGRLRGIVTDRDIVLRCIAPEDDPAQTPVRDVMTRGCYTVAPEADCAAAAHLMAQRQVRRLPVVQQGKLVGMLSLGDLAKCRTCDMEASQALSEISGNILRVGRK